MSRGNTNFAPDIITCYMRSIRILKISRIVILFSLLMAALLTVFLARLSGTDYKKRDMAYYNQCIFGMYDDYAAGMPLEDIEKKYNCRLIFEKDFISRELTAYYSGEALVVDFAPGGEYLGKAVWDDTRSQAAEYKKSVKKSALFFWAVTVCVGYLVIFCVWYFLIKPVRELEQFAVEIAKGNLDIPLARHRNNLFGTFTESFDQMREELKASKEREIAAGVAKKEMVAALSHDIKTPVATIQATCEVMELKQQRLLSKVQEDCVSVPVKEIDDTLEKLGSISGKAGTISGIIENLFHATLDELDVIEVNASENPSLLIEEYLLRLKNAGGNGEIVIDGHIPECLVYIDPLRMEQAIDNVVGNSRKYAGTDIHVSYDMAEGSFVRIRISDSGPGVSESEMALITEKYFRGSAVKGKTGYGLGMYLVKMYMEKQGGGIEYYNDNGFVVELLVKKV